MIQFTTQAVCAALSAIVRRVRPSSATLLGALMVVLALLAQAPTARAQTYSYSGSEGGIAYNGSYTSVPGTLYGSDSTSGDQVSFFTFTIPAGKTYTSARLTYGYNQYNGAAHAITFSALSGAPSIDAAGLNAIRTGTTLASTMSNGSGAVNLPASVVTALNSLSSSGGGTLRIGAYGPKVVDYFGEFHTVALVGDVVAPTVTGLAPNSGPIAGGTSVTITGTNFNGVTGAAGVTFGGTNATSYTVNSATQITAISPAGTGTVNVRVTNDGETSATGAANQFTYAAAPTITAAFSPTTVNAGSTAWLTLTVANPNNGQITGVSVAAAALPANLIGSSPGTTCTAGTATYNGGTRALSLSGGTLNGSASCTVTLQVSTSVAGGYSYTSGTVGSTQSGAGTTATTATPLTVNALVPTVTAVSPSAGPTGGANTVIITGTNLTGASAVMFGGTAATGFTVNGATQITATAPAGAAGTVDIRVTTAGGTSAISANDEYTYVAAPTVTGRSPTSGPTGGGTSVVITGTGFLAAPGIGAVKFGATNATYTINSNTQITATSPARPAGTYDITVATPGGTSATSANDQFTYVAAPTVTGLSPAAGPTGGATTVVITGTNLSNATAVTFGGTAATGFTVNGATQITATAPAGAAGAVNVRVTTVGGTSAVGGANLYTFAAAPTAANVSGANVDMNTATPINLSGQITGLRDSIAVTTAPAHGVTSVLGEVVTYTPTMGYLGTDTFSFTATGPGGTSNPATVSLTVTAAPLMISTSTAVGTAVGVGYSQVNTASGGVTPYTYALNAGAFVPGTTLNASTGVVSGTPLMAGSFSYIIKVTDSQGVPVSATTPVTTVMIAKGDQTVDFTSTAPSSASVGGAAYAVTATATSGLGAVLSLDGASTGCVLSGGSITFTSIGTCRINADQPGDFNWNAASQVQQVFAIGPAGAIGAAVSFSHGSLAVGSAGAMTITFSNPNVAASPAFNVLLTSPSLVNRVAGAPGGSCSTGAASVPTSTTVQFSNVVVPAGSCTITLNYAGATAGSTSGFTLGAFTPAGYPTTSSTGGAGFAVTPSVTSISPPSGPVSQVVTVYGTGFSTTPANNTVIFGAAGAGTVTAASATSLTVTTPGTGSGPVNVTVTVNGQTSAASATYTFIPPPIAANKPGVAVPYNSAGTAIDLSASITGGPHSSIALATAAAHGTISISGDVVTYTPTAGYFGVDSFTYTATGAGGTSGVATVSIVVATPGAPVTADRNGVAIPHNSPGTAIDLSSSVTGVRSSIAVATTPAHGSVAVAGEVATYTPTAGYFGGDSFTFTATGPGGTSAPATVTLTVALPPAPTANGMTSTVPYGATNHVIALTPTGGPATGATITTAPSHGTATASGLSVTYAPTAGYGGPDTIAYTVTGPGGTSAPATISITVTPPTVVINPASGALANGRPGAPYSQGLSAVGGTGPYGFAHTGGGSLPPGLSVSGSSITGMPTAAGTFTFQVTATDASTGTGPFSSAPASYTITVDPLVVVVTPTSAPAATTALAYSLNVTSSGGYGAVSYAASGGLPPGLALSPAGVLSGSPTAGGSYSFTITATDSLGFSGSQAYTLVVSDPVIAVTSPAAGALPGGVGGAIYAPVAFTGSGGQGTHTFALASGTLPAGLTLSTGGVLSGAPTVAGTFTFTVAARDSSPAPGPFASTPTSYTLEIAAPAITVTPAAGALPGGLRTVAYSQTIAASGGTAPYGYAVTTGTLPAGLTLASSGALTGTPTVAGGHAFTVTATDAHGFTRSAAYTLEVGTPAAVAQPKTVVVVGGQSVTIDAAQGATGLDLSAAQIATPPAHGTATANGLIITYTAHGPYAGPDSFTYTVTNPGGVSAPATVTITVNPSVVAGPPKSATILAGQTAVVELTEGASGAPFTGAAVVSVTPAGAGTATIAGRVAGGQRLYDLTFKPDNAFVGDAEVRYTLSNAFATSAPGLATITVEKRPDPTQDAEVTGLITAQSETARRFATAQISNVNRRLEQLHDGQGGGGFSSNLSLSSLGGGLSGGMANDPSELRRMQDAQGVMAGVLGGRGDGGLGFDQGPSGPERRAEDLRTPGRSSGTGGDGERGPWGVWVSGAATFGRIDDGRNREGFKFNTDGLTIGVDRRLGETLILGGAAGWATDTSKIGSNGTHSEADAWSVSLYGSFQPAEKAYFDIVLGYGKLDFDSRRFVTANGAFAYGRRKGDQWFAALTAGWDYRHPQGLHLSPYGRIEAARSTLDAFTEQGGGAYALAYGEQESETATGAIGLRGDYALKTRIGQAIPSFRIEYSYDLQSSGSQQIRYADWLDGNAYSLDAGPLDRNRMLYGLGLDLLRRSGLRMGLDYEGMLSGDQTSGALRVKIETPF